MNHNHCFAKLEFSSTGEERHRAAGLSDQGAAVGAGQGQQPHRAPSLSERAPRPNSTGQCMDDSSDLKPQIMTLPLDMSL